MQRLFERIAAAGGVVDREAGEIRNVKFLGSKSKNRREYTTDALRGAVPLYEGTKIYLNHPSDKEFTLDRKFEDWVGVAKDAHLRSDGIYGTLRLRKNCEHYEGILEAAEQFPGSFGMSHVADGESRLIDGIEIIERITTVFSVDLVCEPATTAGLFESAGASLSVQEQALMLAQKAFKLGGEAIGSKDPESMAAALTQIEAINELMAELVEAA
jgi:hypothetical protein